MHLYIHIPFCHRECPYCAFYKHTPGNTKLRAFVDALVTEAQLRLPKGSAPRSIFMGGGTPSMLSIPHMKRLVAGLGDHLNLSQVKEWTIEANPATFNLEKAQCWKQAGITRISLGIQSFDAELLRLLGREHSPESAKESIHILREAGFDNINIDLMFCLPTQSKQQWIHSLEEAIALKIEHISTYNLTLEEGTDFYTRYAQDEASEQELEATEDRDVEFFTLADEILRQAGYRHYEISNYAKQERRSIHNLACWEGEDYCGLGPSAASTMAGLRRENTGDTTAYIQALSAGQLPPAQEEILDKETRRTELIALALRTDEGLPAQQLREQDEDYLQNLQKEGLAKRGLEGQIILTTKGRLLCDEISLGLMR